MMNLENIMLSEKSQSQKDILYDSIYMKYLKLSSLERQKEEWWLPVAEEEE